MLNRLIKHEIRSTARIIVPMLAAILVLSAVAGLFLRVLTSDLELIWTFKTLMWICEASYVLGLFAVCVVTFVLIIRRFYKNLMGDEGYISMTLPVTVDGHIWSKLLVSTGWCIVVGLVCVLSMLIFTTIGATDLDLAEITDFIRALGTRKMTLYIIESAVLVIFSCFSSNLRFYCAMAIGCSSSNHKKLLSFAAYVGIGIIENIIGVSILGIGVRAISAEVIINMSGFEDVASFINLSFRSLLAGTVILGAIYYVITRAFMTKKLNLA